MRGAAGLPCEQRLERRPAVGRGAEDLVCVPLEREVARERRRADRLREIHRGEHRARVVHAGIGFERVQRHASSRPPADDGGVVSTVRPR